MFQLPHESSSKDDKRLKVGLSPSKKIYILLASNESPLKMMKSAFHFALKAPIVLKIFNVFGHIAKRAWLERKINLISKFMTSQPG